MPGMIAYTFNASTQETEANELLGGQGQPSVHTKTLSPGKLKISGSAL